MFWLELAGGRKLASLLMATSPSTRSRRSRAFRLTLVVSITTALLAGLALPASADPSISDVRNRVKALQEDAAAAGESAQQAQVQLNTLTKTLASVQQAAASDAAVVGTFQKSLGLIAREEYKTGGLSQSLELLFSSNPTLYLSAAGSLEAVTRKKALEIRNYSVAKQRLTATSLTVNDKLALVKAAAAKYKAQQAAANAKLAEAQKLLASLSKAEQARIAALNDAQENADQAASLAAAKGLNLGSGRGAKALRFALNQIGDRYVFGAAGMVYWDCSGLTMRAFQTAGVSLPHSAAAQTSFGRNVPFSKLQPGDLVFFVHSGSHYVSHVGIYLGGGRMVNAPRPGSRVKIESFGSSFGSLRFYSARRI